MFILAGLLIPCGALMGLLSTAVGKLDVSQLPPESAAEFQKLEQLLSASGWTLAQVFLAMSLGTLVAGFVLLALGIFVRRGGMGSAVTGIIVCCLLSLMALMSVFGSVMSLAQGNGQAAMPACIWGVLLVVFLYTLISLFQAAKNSGQISAYRMGYSQGFPTYPQNYPPQAPSQQPQTWQQPPAGQWGQPAWPPTPQPPQPPKPPQQNWPPPPPPPSNPT
jgi:hypothetical protein